MFCFNMPRCNPTEADDIQLFQVQCLCRADLLFSFSGLDIQPPNLKPDMDVFVLFSGGETAGKLQVKYFVSRNVVIKNSLLTIAHALLTLCSRSPRFFLSPYEFPFGSLRGSAHGAHRLLTVCSRFSHGLLVLLTLCSRFGG